MNGIYSFSSETHDRYRYISPASEAAAPGRARAVETSHEGYGAFPEITVESSAKSNWPIIKKVTAVFAVFAASLAVVAALAAFPPIVFTAAVIVASVSLSPHVMTFIFDRIQINHFKTNADNIKTRTVDGGTESIVCKDTVESFEWKKKLIENAKSEIVLSGNYCGKGTYDIILEMIENKMANNSQIKVCILSSTKFWTPKNNATMDRLRNKYPERFSVIPTDDMWQVNPSLKKVTNHTKALIVDRKFAVMGGSGLEDKYAEAKGIGDREQTVSHPSISSNPSEGDSELSETMDEGSVMRYLLPRGFRDEDFVFKALPSAEVVREGVQEAPLTSIQHLHYEVLKLACLWDKMNAKVNGGDSDTVPHKMLQAFKDDPKAGDIEIADFEEKKTNGPCDTKIYATGPEGRESPFLRDMIDKVNNATTEIFISQMYFHPNQELFDAFKNAANRGVKIHLMTNGNEKYSPGGHKFFGPRNQYNYATLARAIDEDKRENFRVFEYGNKHHNTPRKTTYHKKVMVVDDYLIAGSGNMGYKSLQTMSDYEINFISKSQSMADKHKEIFWYEAYGMRQAQKSDGSVVKKNGEVVYARLSKEVHKPETKINARIRCVAIFHRLIAFRVG